MTAILAASSLKQSLKPGAMRDDPTMSIDGIKGKNGVQEGRQVILQALRYLSIGITEARMRGRQMRQGCERRWPT